MGELELLLWATRAFAVGVTLLALAVILACWWTIAGRAFTELWRGWRVGDLWLPFVPDERGEWGPLTSNIKWGAFRAAERGSTAALSWRWGWWMFAALALTVGVFHAVWGLGRLIVMVWE